VILGPLVGAFIFEYIFARKSFNDSLKAGIGSLIGLIVTIILKTGVNVAMIIYVVTKLINK
jgi:uncharacterized protein YqgC (DUF456 family)